jgi:hypothetical protein
VISLIIGWWMDADRNVASVHEPPIRACGCEK